MSVFDVDAQKLIEKVAAELRKIEDIEAPEWAQFVKSGAHRERPPQREDWWYIRAASILRAIYKKGPIGVSKLRSKYGGAKNRGVKPNRFTKASGKVIRVILQQLELSDLVKRADSGVSKGRIITPKGQSILDKAAISLGKAKPKKVEAKPKKVEKAKPKAEKKEKEVKKAEKENVKQKTKSKEKKTDKSKQA